MALINAESRPCALIVATSIDDGEGGQLTEYKRTLDFQAIVSEGTAYKNTNKTLGYSETSAKAYKFFYPKEISLELSDIVTTLDDGKYYKVSTSPTKPAKSASVQYCLVTAEEWELPNE